MNLIGKLGLSWVYKTNNKRLMGSDLWFGWSNYGYGGMRIW